MNNKICAMVIMYLGITPWAFASKPTFAITSSCVTSIEIGEVSYAPLVKLSISLNDETAKYLLTFSKSNLKKKVIFVDGTGNILSEARIMTPITSPFVIVGLESESIAKEVAKKVTASKGVCGRID